jgi:hypothetical protein
MGHVQMTDVRRARIARGTLLMLSGIAIAAGAAEILTAYWHDDAIMRVLVGVGGVGCGLGLIRWLSRSRAA